MNYKAVILAGGKGTRLYPITKEIPKPLLPVKQKPMINHLVDLFLSYEIKEIAVLVGEEFKKEFKEWKEDFYPEIKLIFEEKPLGTFGGLFYLKDWINKDHFFLANADDLTSINLKEMIEFHKETNLIATLASVKSKELKRYGLVIIEDKKVKEFVEKPENPSSEYINSGLYLFSPEIFQYHKGLEFQMVEKDVFPLLAKEGKLGGFQFEGEWVDCGTWEAYARLIDK